MVGWLVFVWLVACLLVWLVRSFVHSFFRSFFPSLRPLFLSFCIYVSLLILTGVSDVLIPTCLSALPVLYKGSLHSRILILKNSFKSTSYKIILFPLFIFMLRILFVSLYRSLYGIYRPSITFEYKAENFILLLYSAVLFFFVLTLPAKLGT